MRAPLVSFPCSNRERPIHSQPLDVRSTVVIHWADRTFSSVSIPAVKSRSTAGIPGCRVVCAVCVDLEPSISISTVHSHALSPAREFKTRRARFNVDRWIQDQRPTFVDHARARTLFPRGLGPSDSRSTAQEFPRLLSFKDFPKD